MILVDAGPLVALVDAADRHHRRCAAALKTVVEPVGTVWPVVAEALDRLAGVQRGQEAVLEMIERRSLAVLELNEDDAPRLRELLRRHRGATCAELALRRVAERDEATGVMTLDGRRLGNVKGRNGRRLRIVSG